MRRRACRAALLIVSVLLAAAAPGAVAAAQLLADAQLAQKSAARTAVKKSSAKSSSAAKAQPVWKFSRSAGVPTLEYGTPNTGETLISFSCQPDTGLLRVISQIGSRGLRPGDGAAILLVNGKMRFEVAGTAFSTQSREIVDIGATSRIDPKLFALFRTGDTLIVDVPGRKRSLAVSAAKPSADAFEKACTASKQPATG
ncbi:MAG: hypothetical protein WD871_06660 [Xanthobacteraceae bacterium]